MSKLRFAVFGTGFWSNFQIPGWLESPDVELVALYNRTLSKAKEVAKRFDVNRVYDNPEVLLEEEDLDFVDIITDVDTHFKFSAMAANRGLDVVCQKPLAPSLSDAQQMIRVCDENKVKLFVNENFRWQAPIRRVKALMDEGVIGEVFKGRVTFCSAFLIFENQPFLKDLDRFILTDVGSHILDVCRFLFGEARTIYCITKRVNPTIQGEDVANVLMEMQNGIHCFAEMSYASILEHEVFPETLLLIEGDLGSIHLTANYEIRVTNKYGLNTEMVQPAHYDWADPEYAIVHSSIVDAQMNILDGLKGGTAETTGEDNYQTVKLVWAAYQSAENRELVDLENFGL